MSDGTHAVQLVSNQFIPRWVDSVWFSSRLQLHQLERLRPIRMGGTGFWCQFAVRAPAGGLPYRRCWNPAGDTAGTRPRQPVYLLRTIH